ncbi:Ribokinase [Erysiphe neolycopersici]|uniref:Ribokinase n=1 Tax=Erysiphe neolycopersici TaxID=212602 RepID=A0A420HV49_9PEZI|nr:Ribokinase [Erysiphe neolycopersici]
MKYISIIGSLNTDLVTTTIRLPIGGETLTATSFFTGLGGKGANQAVACARLSQPNPSASLQSKTSKDVIVKMIGAVGADEFGPRMKSLMAIDGVDTSKVEVKEGQKTGVAVIIVEESTGENRILLNPGANYTLTPDQFEQVSSLGNPLPDIIILQLEIPLPTVLRIIRIAKKAGVEVVLNPAPAIKLPAEAYQNLSHLILNESEASTLTGRSLSEVSHADFDWEVVIKEFLAKGVQNVIITLGARGAYFASNTTKEVSVKHLPAFKVDKVVDTTAAGDTFVGSYTLDIVRGEKNIEEIIRYACLTAARTIEKRGAQESIPWSNEVDR